MKEKDIKKSAPEFSFYHKVKAFFDGDDDFEISEIDEEEYEFDIDVYNKRKYEILKQVLSIPKQAVRLKININDCSDEENVGEKELAYLLEGNKYFSRYLGQNENGLIPSLMRFVLMKPKVVQYYDDIFNNPAGLETKTAEAIAKEIFKGSHCNISSDIKD